MNNKVSVIVPVYKVEKYLDRCVESIVNQTYKNLEIILVDDGSPDNCPQLCDSWAEKDSRIKVIHKENGGVSSARNAGIDAASGEYIGFVDSDDYLDSKMYEELVTQLESSASDISCCLLKTAAVSDGAGKTETFDQNSFLNYMFKKGDYSVCNKLFSKNLIRDIRFSSEILIGEDGYFLYQSVKRANAIVLNYTDFYKNCDDVQNSLTRNNSNIESWYSNLMISREIWNNEKNNPAVRANSSFDYANCILNFIANSVRFNCKSRNSDVRKIVKSDYCDIISAGLNKKTSIRMKLVRHFPKLYNMILKIYFIVK